jgi:hypothetical protein
MLNSHPNIILNSTWAVIAPCKKEELRKWLEENYGLDFMEETDLLIIEGVGNSFLIRNSSFGIDGGRGFAEKISQKYKTKETFLLWFDEHFLDGPCIFVYSDGKEIRRYEDNPIDFAEEKLQIKLRKEYPGQSDDSIKGICFIEGRTRKQILDSEVKTLLVESAEIVDVTDGVYIYMPDGDASALSSMISEFFPDTRIFGFRKNGSDFSCT